MTTRSPPPISAVIFDMDGLLLDTESIYTDAMQRTLQRHGRTFDRGLRERTVGLGAQALAEQVVEALSLPIAPGVLLDEREVHLSAGLANARVMPGARELVQHLARHGLPMAVATSSRRSSFELKSSRHREWFGLFEAVVTPDDVPGLAPKPAPDLFLQAALRLGVQPGQALVFEDSAVGLRGALAAGMRVVVVPDAQADRATLAGAAVILDSLADFEPQVWGLPGRLD